MENFDKYSMKIRCLTCFGHDLIILLFYTLYINIKKLNIFESEEEVIKKKELGQTASSTSPL